MTGDGAPPYSDTDVLIVGAGPVGLTLALLLAKYGRSVAVYERQAEPFPLPRAAAMSHETVRVLQSAGVLERLRPYLDLELGKLVASYFATDGEVLMTMTFPGVGESGYPPMTGFPPARCGPGAERGVPGASADRLASRMVRQGGRGRRTTVSG